MQYTASTTYRTALPRSKRRRQGSDAQATAASATAMSSEGEKLWASETDPDTNETEVATANPIKIVNRLRITDDNGTTYGTISLDANGRFYFDKGIISAEDVVAYGIRSTDVQTVTDLINSIIDAKGTGSGTIDNVEVTGTGNAISSATLSADGKKITLTKGITALTEHQSLDGYATEAWVEGKGYLTTHQDISGKADKNMTMMRRGYIASGDLDSYRDEAGTYGCDLTTVNNKPDGAYNWGDLIVTGWNNYTSSQIYIPDNGSGMYVRTYWNGGWRAWNQVALAKQLSNYLPLAGGTMSGELNFTYNNTTSRSNLMMAFAPSSTWSDGTNSHPQYGWDMRYHNTGVYSSVLSSYFGMLFHTQLGTLCMTQAGNVGIGTTTPSVKLDVNGRISTPASTGSSAGGGLHVGNCKILQYVNSLILTSNDIRFGAKDSGWDLNQWAGLKYDHANKKIYLGLADGSIFACNQAQTSGTVQLVNCGLVASGDVTAYSDARLKSDIKDLNNRGYLRPVEYVKDNKKSIGFIAQEVRDLYPEVVVGDEKKGYLSVNYGAITAILQKQIIEQQKQIDELRAELNKLKK